MRFDQIMLAMAVFCLCHSARAETPNFQADVRPLLVKFCVECHSGDKPKGELDFSKIETDQDAVQRFDVWESAIDLVKEGEMPPEDAPQLTAEQRVTLEDWYQGGLVKSIKAQPGFFKPRRLSATEYRNTLRSLFGFDLELSVIEAEQTAVEKSLVMKVLPLDPPGKSGFRNDTSGNPLTTLIWDQYAYLSDTALEQMFSRRERPKLEAIVGPIREDRMTVEQAKQLLQTFLPRVYRRPVSKARLTTAYEKVDVSTDLVKTLKTEFKAALMSPGFMYRGLLMDGKPDVQQPVDGFELAERLSYFVWADMPDAELMEWAKNGKLLDAGGLNTQIDRMLASPKARSLAEDFAFQWLTLDEIQKSSKNLPQRFALRSQPVEFMNYLFTTDRPLIELVDSRVAFASPFTRHFYSRDQGQMARYSKPKGIEVEIVPNQRITLEHTTERGGILTMPGILTMNKGPVLRGVWMLERILGDHLPDPPPDAGQVPKNERGQNLTFRQRFALHRSKAICAVCHNKIDPLGFGMEGYDGGGEFVAGNKKSNIDTAGRLPSGESFENFQQLKEILVTTQREKVIRNIVRQMLSYALCRKLEAYDRPTVDNIVNKMVATNGTYRELIHEIANSLPFRQTFIRGKKT